MGSHSSLTSSQSLALPVPYSNCWAFDGLPHLVAQMVKNLPAMQETRVRSLSQEDPLEKEMTTHSSIVAWRIPWTEEPGGLQSTGVKKDLDMT